MNATPLQMEYLPHAKMHYCSDLIFGIFFCI